MGLTLLVLTGQVYAAGSTLTWDDPNNNAANVGGYTLSTWQGTSQTPTSIDVGKPAVLPPAPGAKFSYTMTGLGVGQTYTFAVTAHNSTGGQVSAYSNMVNQLMPDTQAPTVSLTSPLASSTVSGTLTVSANAADNVKVVGVQFRLDGVALGSEDITAPYTVSWNTTTATNAGHSLTAVARDAAGNSTTSTSVMVTVNNLPQPPPVANFSATPSTGQAPLIVTFTSTSTGGTITSWAWTFGDGGIGTGSNTSHTYNTMGTYPVKLTVMGPGGSYTTNAVSITVTASPPPPPVANFSATPTTGQVPLDVTFTSISTGTITSWDWNFGDGTPHSSVSNPPKHQYTQAGSYTVSLTISGPGGSRTATKANYITVTSNAVGLVAAYSFDAGIGTTVADASGSNNNGTITGAAWTTQGKFGAALVFNGVNNWVTVNDAAALDLTAAMTLEAWVYPTVRPTGWRTVIQKENTAYYLHAGSDLNQPATGILSGGEQILVGGTRLAANTWAHLAATYDGTRQRLYINGVEVANRVQTGAIQGSAGALRIGGNSVWGEYFQGRIDEVRIYNRALSVSEIQADMGAPVNLLNTLAQILP